MRREILAFRFRHFAGVDNRDGFAARDLVSKTLAHLFDDACDLGGDARDFVRIGFDGRRRRDPARNDARADLRRRDLGGFDLSGGKPDFAVGGPGLDRLALAVRRDAAAHGAEERRQRGANRQARENGKNQNGPITGHDREVSSVTSGLKGVALARRSSHWPPRRKWGISRVRR